MAQYKDRVKTSMKFSVKQTALLAASFTAHALYIALPFASGVLFKEWCDVFPDVPRAELAWIVALNNGLLLGCGPLSSLIIGKIGLRLCYVIGTLLTAVGVGLSSFAQEPYQLMLSFGVMSGLGNSMAYLPAIVVVNVSFSERHLMMANTVVTSGVGFGVILAGPLLEVLINRFGWSGCLVVLSGVALQGCVLFPFIRPPAGYHENGQKKEEVKKESPVKNEEVEEKCTHSTHPGEINSAQTEYILDLEAREKEGTPAAGDNSPVQHRFRKRSPHLLLWRISAFRLLFVAEFLWSVTAVIMSSMLPKAASLAGHSDTDSALLITWNGAASLLGRALSIPLSLALHLNPLLTFMMSTAATAVPLLCFPFASSLLHFILIAVTYGLPFGLQLACIAPSVIQTVPIRHLVIGFGWLMLADGTGSLAGPPIAGALFDLTQSYDAAFLLAGSFSTLSSLLMLLSLLVLRCDRSNSEKEAKQ